MSAGQLGLPEAITIEHLRGLAPALNEMQTAGEMDDARQELFRRVTARIG